MPTTRTRCVHCERETEITVPDTRTAIVGKSKALRTNALDWVPQKCRNCNQRFGVKYG